MGQPTQWAGQGRHPEIWTVRLEITLLYYCENIFGFHKDWVGGNGVTESDSKKNLMSESKGLNPEGDLLTLICVSWTCHSVLCTCVCVCVPRQERIMLLPPPFCFRMSLLGNDALLKNSVWDQLRIKVVSVLLVVRVAWGGPPGSGEPFCLGDILMTFLVEEGRVPWEQSGRK